MASKYTARIGGVLRWLGSAVLNISRPDRARALMARYQVLDDQMADLYAAYRAVLELGLEADAINKINADIDQADDLADQIVQAVECLRGSSTADARVTAESEASPALMSRLPLLDLPRFNGDLDQWVAFSNLFESIVHGRTDLTPAQKLAYLLASLTGEAKGLVQHLGLVDGNYEIARDLLSRRYQNVRRIADSHVATILGLPQISVAQSLRTRLLNPLLIAVNGLKGLDLPVSSWSFLLLHVILSKLPHDLRNRFELEYGGDSATHLPSFDNLILFLEDECRRTENVPPPSPGPTVGARRVRPGDSKFPAGSRHRPRLINAAVGQTQESRCNYCRDTGHGVTGCPKFRELRWQARRNIA
ncbi:PREDICTED: uncharacterized protein LOC106127801, partial [Papilio xuthus]|uniref:Uncharacterized protein LOC106127801 n=1 Tax=Papilio xuthus TaxID=66420 RepID=A0AAJ6ZY17_PAPXU